MTNSPTPTTAPETAPGSTPDELYREGLRLLLEKDIPGWVDLWDEDGVLEFPFAPEGWPARLEGRQAIADYMRHYPDHIDVHDFRDVRIHRTAAPGTIMVEMRGVGRLVETGSPFDTTYITVITVEGGRFTSCRDYWSPLAVQQPGADFVGTNR
ncbi:nuclear transport factor 2 family protein [Streptomyces sp. NPDC021093]|uniref:nuclear transport factor 2 family protein n=1 Tax=Streptomyces sp. NPDC021093 TaxID=3365112 RepID=UPI0037877941